MNARPQFGSVLYRIADEILENLRETSNIRFDLRQIVARNYGL